MKRWHRIFGAILLLTYIGASSKPAYSYHDNKQFAHYDTWPLDSTTKIDQDFEVAGFGGALVRGALRTLKEPPRPTPRPTVRPQLPEVVPPGPPIRPAPVPDDSPNVLHGRTLFGVHAQADVTARAIIKIADFVDDAPSLNGLLKEEGFLPTHAAWNKFPAVRKVEIAYTAAEEAIPGGGNDLLGNLAHRLRGKYQSVGDDPVLKPFLATPPKPSIQFAAIERLSPPNVRLPGEITEIIYAIVKYCDSGVLSGIGGLLERLGLSVDDVYHILSLSNSNIEAFVSAIDRLDPAVAIARTKVIIEDIQRTYESARHIVAFNDFLALQVRQTIAKEEFMSSIRWRIERKYRVDALPPDLRAPGPTNVPLPSD